MARCMQCGKELTHNEIGAHRKFINRGAEQFFCKQCLSKHLGVTPELIDEKIEQFKRQGCTLFVCKRQIIIRLDTRLLQPFASWSNSL